MTLAVDDHHAEAKSRLVGIRLTLLTLRLMNNWRRQVSDFESALILLAITAINSEKLTRATLEAELEDLRRPYPRDQLSACNISSIAMATGLNRETTRRRVNKLVQAGLLERGDDGSVAYREGVLQDPEIVELVRLQLETLTRTANDLIRDGSVKVQRDGRPTGEQRSVGSGR